MAQTSLIPSLEFPYEVASRIRDASRHVDHGKTSAVHNAVVPPTMQVIKLMCLKMLTGEVSAFKSNCLLSHFS